MLTVLRVSRHRVEGRFGSRGGSPGSPSRTRPSVAGVPGRVDSAQRPCLEASLRVLDVLHEEPLHQRTPEDLLYVLVK